MNLKLQKNRCKCVKWHLHEQKDRHKCVSYIYFLNLSALIFITTFKIFLLQNSLVLLWMQMLIEQNWFFLHMIYIHTPAHLIIEILRYCKMLNRQDGLFHVLAWSFGSSLPFSNLFTQETEDNIIGSKDLIIIFF